MLTGFSQPSRGRALSALASHGLVFDALIKPIHIESHREDCAPASRSFHRHRSRRETHYGQFGGSRVAGSATGLGVVPERRLQAVRPADRAGARAWTLAKVLECADVVLQLFGPSRVIWGSDWPVLTLASTL